MRNCNGCIFVQEKSGKSLYCRNMRKSVQGNYFCAKHITKGILRKSAGYSIET